MLNEVNEKRRNVIGYQEFYIDDLEDIFNIRDSYMNWFMARHGRAVNLDPFHIVDYPFVFNASAKSEMLVADQILSMQKAVMESQLPVMMFGPFVPHDADGYLRVDVRRDRLLADTMTAMSIATERSLKKPMRVTFVGEEAEDAGGVTKEFFLLLIKELLDPKYGMFQEYEETRTIWFSTLDFEDDLTNYTLVGNIRLIICESIARD